MRALVVTRVEPCVGRRLRGPHRAGARRGAGRRSASRSTGRGSCPTATRSRQRLREAVASSYDVVVTSGGTGISPDRPHPRDDPPGARPRPARASPRRCGRTASRKGVPTAALSRGLAGLAGTHARRQPARARPAGCATGWSARPAARARGRAGARGRPLSTRGPTMTRGWPATLAAGRVGLRPIAPPRPGGLAGGARPQRRLARAVGGDPAARRGPAIALRGDGAHPAPRRPGAGTLLPFVVTYDGRAGRPGHGRRHHLGLAVLGARRLLGRPAGGRARRDADRGRAGRPTTASARSGCTASRSTSGRRTRASLRVVREARLPRGGPRDARSCTSHGAWRDHRSFALTAERCRGLLPAGGSCSVRWRAAPSHTNHTRPRTDPATHRQRPRPAPSPPYRSARGERD